MKIFRSTLGFKKWRDIQYSSRKIGFVPTMGALHEGHFSLIRQAKKENGIVVVSIFVNPTQFGPKEDFKRYPRPWKDDINSLKDLDVDVLLAPSPRDMYSTHHSTVISVKNLNNVLCGAPTSRGPGHFDGVATVVAKLFNIVRPSKAYFGLKDYQQVRIIEQMVEDLNMDVQIVRCGTIRTRDGVALSSRNRYLNEHELKSVPLFQAALQYGRKLLTSKPKMTLQNIRTHVRRRLASLPNSRVEYLELVDPVTLQSIKSHQKSVLIAAAIFLGKTRLIDNILIKQ